jgi:stage II sporulation protein R
MVKRTGWSSWQSFSIMRYVYTIIAIMMLVASWEASRTEAAIAGQMIPEESIRLRILANSDAPMDQWLKREVRDAIVEQMNQWVTGPQDIEDARAVIGSHLGELHVLVGEVIQRSGFTYEHKVELGVVPFPTKMYGSVVYPAGDYEALRVTIGSGEGQNWWCVLFPPLCFVDVTTGEAVAAAKDAVVDQESETQKTEKKSDVKSSKKELTTQDVVKTASASAQLSNEAVSLKDTQPEVRSFIWDSLKKLGSKVKSWFA